jgi:pyridoxamine 5'-phosphate oxidase
MNEWWLSLPTTLDQVWLRLGRGVVDRKADARHPMLATAGAGGPEARIVVLRQAVRALSAVSVYTDIRSAKITDLRQETRASLLVWEQKARLQIRLRAHVEILSGQAVAEQWQRVPSAARNVYGSQPSPGTPMDHPNQLLAQANPDVFAVLVCNIKEIETLYLGPDLHQRAKFCADTAWAGQWLAP